MESVKSRYYEVVRAHDASEDDFLAEVTAAGFKLEKNYDALPFNYRFSCPEGMAERVAHARLNACLTVVGDGEKGDKQIVKGDAVTSTPVDFRTTITHPMHRLQENIPQRALDGSNLPYSTEYGRQWGLARICAPIPNRPPFTYVKPGDYDFEVNLVGNGVDYYILDTGIDPDHPEFDEDVYGTRAFMVAGGDTFYEVGEDDQNHGNAMATCGAGKTIGLAVNSRVFAAKGLDGNNSGSSSALLDGMNALVSAFNADTSLRPGVMNNSWSTTSSTAYAAATAAAIDAGMIMVASAGNADSATVNYPAGHPDVISVLAFDIGDYRSSFSSFGSWIDVCAPGREILQGGRGGTIRWGDGTSPAGGLTTGWICALMQGFRRPANRAQVQAVRNWVLGLCVDGLISTPDGTTSKMIFLGRRDNPSIGRPTGLQNLLVPWGQGVRQASVNRNVSKPPGIGPAWTAKTDYRVLKDKAPLFIGTPTPTAASVTPFQTRAQMQWATWLFRNHGWANADVAASGVDARRLGYVVNVAASTDADGDSLAVPNREGTTGDFSYIGNSNGVNARAFQFIPVRMVAESNPVSLFDVFSNVDFQDGSFAGWTVTGGSAVKTVNTGSTLYAYAGTHWAESTGNGTIEQTVTLPASISTTKIDAGKMRLFAQLMFGTSFAATDDTCRVRIQALTAADADLGFIFDTGTSVMTGTIGWDTMHMEDVLLPATTRKLRVLVEWTLVGGTIANRTFDGLAGWIYEETREGERLRNAIKTGEAGVRLNMLHRSLNISSDDRLQPELDFYGLGTQSLIQTHQSFYRSTHNWTEIGTETAVPAGTEVIVAAMRMNRRAGTVNNAYFRDVTLDVLMPRKQRRLGSTSRNVSKPAALLVPTTGGQAGAIVGVGS